MKVSVVASECSPFFKTGGLADVIGSLPEALSQFDCQVEVLLPLFRSQVPLHLSYVQTYLTTVNWRTHECSVYDWKQNNVRYLFLNKTTILTGVIYTGITTKRNGSHFSPTLSSTTTFCVKINQTSFIAMIGRLGYCPFT